MTVACGGRCGRPDCNRTFKDADALNGHVGGVKARRGAAGKSGSSGSLSPPKGSPVSPESSRPFYEGLQTLPWGKEEPTKGTAPTAAQVSASPPGPLFDSSLWWLNLGKLLDETLLADKKVKINMGADQAKRLDASLQAAGWRVEANPNPISMPYWLPFAISAIGAFALPIAAAYIPDFIRKARERAKVAREAAQTTYHVEVPKPSGIQPQTPAPSAPGDEEDASPIRIEASPPPFAVRPMPWHEPGAG